MALSSPAESTAPWRAVPAWPGLLARRRRLLVFFGGVVIANTLIAWMLTGLGGRDRFTINFVYSQSIGLTVLALMLGPVMLLQAQRGWRRLALLALSAVAIPAGFVLGLEIGSWLNGLPSLLFSEAPAMTGLSGLLVLTTLISIGCGLLYGSRERVAALELEAARARERAAAERIRAEVASRQAIEAQLALLRAQLEPHMLFNTLANLRSLIALDPAQALAMMDRLIAWLRASLTASRIDSMTLADEFSLLRDYLDLIAVRMGPRLAYSLDLPAALAGQPVPALLLQPLVENAVRHGLEPLADGGRIDVFARVEGGMLLLTVEDGGAGFLPDAAASGFGLAQVRQRLGTAHGDRATLSVLSPLPCDEARSGGASEPVAPGTRITIGLPLVAGPPAPAAPSSIRCPVDGPCSG